MTTIRKKALDDNDAKVCVAKVVAPYRAMDLDPTSPNIVFLNTLTNEWSVGPSWNPARIVVSAAHRVPVQSVVHVALQGHYLAIVTFLRTYFFNVQTNTAVDIPTEAFCFGRWVPTETPAAVYWSFGQSSSLRMVALGNAEAGVFVCVTRSWHRIRPAVCAYDDASVAILDIVPVGFSRLVVALSRKVTIEDDGVTEDDVAARHRRVVIQVVDTSEKQWKIDMTEGCFQFPPPCGLAELGRTFRMAVSSKYVVCSAMVCLLIWERATGELVMGQAAVDSPPTALAFESDGRTLLVGQPRSIVVFQPQWPTGVFHFDHHGGGVSNDMEIFRLLQTPWRFSLVASAPLQANDGDDDDDEGNFLETKASVTRATLIRTDSGAENAANRVRSYGVVLVDGHHMREKSVVIMQAM